LFPSCFLRSPSNETTAFRKKHALFKMFTTGCCVKPRPAINHEGGTTLLTEYWWRRLAESVFQEYPD
jgi:hypothetical protein